MTNPFDSLAKSAAALNQVTSELNTLLEKFETTVNSYNIGVGAWVRLNDDQWKDTDDSYEVIRLVGYDKFKGKWQLCFCHYLEVEGPPGEEVPLRDASREARLAALEQLPLLATELAKAVQLRATEASSKVKNATIFLSALTAAKKK